MPAEPISSSGLRPILSITAMVTKQAAIETTPETMLIASDWLSVKPASCHKRRAVIEDDVDADELLERGEHDADPDDRADAEQAAAPLMSLKPRTVVGAEASRGSRRAWRAATSLPNRLVSTPRACSVAALGHEVARAFRDEEQRDEEDRRRERLHQEHPAPRLDAAPEARGRNARRSSARK